MDLPFALTVPEAAKLLRVNRTRAYELVQKGVIPSVRLGPHQIRIRRDTLLKWMEGGQALVGHDTSLSPPRT